MKKLLMGAFASAALLCFSAGALADEVSEVWTCTLEEGKTLDDAQTANSKWLAWMRANVNEGIRSMAATAVVGNSQEFRWVDTYPDLATWAAAKAALDTEEGNAIEAVFAGITKCGKNELVRARPTK